MTKSYLDQNFLGTLACHCMNVFFGRLRKAKVISIKLKNEWFYAAKRVFFNHQKLQNMQEYAANFDKI
jgi:hypothetical protein